MQTNANQGVDSALLPSKLSCYLVKKPVPGIKAPQDLQVVIEVCNTEVEPLIEEQKRDALKMTKNFGVQIGCIITRCTVRRNE